MPPPAVKSIKDLTYYHYAMIIAASAGIPGHEFVMSRMKMPSDELESKINVTINMAW